MLLWLSKECDSYSLLNIGAKKKIKTKYCDYLLCVQSPFFLCFYKQLKNNLWRFFLYTISGKNKIQVLLWISTCSCFSSSFFVFVYFKCVFLEQKNCQRRLEDTSRYSFHFISQCQGTFFFGLMIVMFMDLLQVTIFWVWNFVAIFFEMLLLNSVATLKGYCNACHFKYLVLKQ